MVKKLIIIDDNSTQLNILKTLFTNQSWDVCGVQNAKIGYEMIFDFAPDLIITDAIMPLMGGFQLIKMIRENEKISKIPVIIYSVLNEVNAKFYVKEDLNEFFLKKDNNLEELFELATKVVQKYPLDKEYKEEILKIGLKNFETNQNTNQIDNSSDETEEIETNSLTKTINLDTLKNNLNTIFDFSFGDEKIVSTLFPLLFEALDYDLSVICIHSFEENRKKSYFDIKNIILSPILKNNILNNLDSDSGVMYKKYSPNLQTVVNESEFLSKLEFNFNYKDNFIADVLFYSRKKLKWEEENEGLNEILYQFFKKRHIQRSTQNNKKEDTIVKYEKQISTKFDNIKVNLDAYFAMITLTDLSDLTTTLPKEDLDILNSKISHKIIDCLDKDEQVYKNDEATFAPTSGRKTGHRGH